MKSIDARAKALLEFARQLAGNGGMDWLKANNLVFGPGGKAAELFPSRADRVALAGLPVFDQINAALGSLPTPKPTRGRAGVKSPESASGKILVRVPKSMHAQLLREAEAEGVSLNQLCVAKLALQLGALM